MIKLLFVVLTLLLVALPCQASTVRVAKEQRTLYPRDHYLYELLNTALKNTPYQTELISVHPHQQRSLMQLSRGQLDIHWSMTSTLREKIAIPVRIPLFKGLIGWRVLLVASDSEQRFVNIETENELKRLLAVQGHDWPDAKILMNNGYRVKPLPHYEAMFSLTKSQRVEYFPRSVIEVHDELKQFGRGLAIDKHILLKYPTAFYFFVNKEKKELATALQLGLLKMQQSGEFDTIFSRYFRENLSKLELSKRRTFELENHLLPLQTPLEEQGFWYKE